MHHQRDMVEPNIQLHPFFARVVLSMLRPMQQTCRWQNRHGTTCVLTWGIKKEDTLVHVRFTCLHSNLILDSASISLAATIALCVSIDVAILFDHI